MELTVLAPNFPAGAVLKVAQIESKNQIVNEAQPWDIVGVSFKKVRISRHTELVNNIDLYYRVSKLTRFGALLVEKDRAPRLVKSFVTAIIAFVRITKLLYLANFLILFYNISFEREISDA